MMLCMNYADLNLGFELMLELAEFHILFFVTIRVDGARR